jgi:hypothetical protein
MTLDGTLTALENTPFASAVRGDWEWAFPNIETIHVLSLALVFGSILMIDLRLLGVTSRNSTVSKLSAEVLPFTWIAFVIAAISGTLLFISNARIYFHNLQFELKFLCMFLAAINMAVFHFGAYRSVLQWDNRLPPPLSARVAGGLSILLWVSVIFFGRWIGFVINK